MSSLNYTRSIEVSCVSIEREREFIKKKEEEDNTPSAGLSSPTETGAREPRGGLPFLFLFFFWRIYIT